MTTSTPDSDLICAVHACDPSRLQDALARGANINARDIEGRTPLLLAAGREGGEEMVRLLLEKGADANIADSHCSTPLIEASRWGRVEAAKMLMDKGASVDASDRLGWTSLIWIAAEEEPGERRLTIAKELLAHGANVLAQSFNDHATALDLATANQNRRMLKLLAAHAPAGGDPVDIALQHDVAVRGPLRLRQPS